MLLCQDSIICKGRDCSEAEPLPGTHKTFRTVGDRLGSSNSVMYSRKQQGRETSKYILLFTAQAVLLKEAKLACALLLGWDGTKNFNFCQRGSEGREPCWE